MPDASAGRKYQAIAAELRSAIQAGTYAPGDRLPGENDIMREYSVARMTARQALAVLVNEGLVIPRKGAGVYVREFRPLVRAGIGRLASGIWRDGRSIWSADVGNRDLHVDQVQVHREEPPGHVRILFDLDGEDAQVVARRRRFVLDGKPVLLSVSYLPVDLVGGSAIEQEDTGPGGTYARLADLGYAPARFREDLRSRMPEPDETERLALDPGTPVVEIARTAYTEDGRVVELNEMTADAGSYVFRYDFGA